MGVWGELRRRSVFRVAGVYVVVAWLVAQAAAVLAGMLPLPAWFGSFVVALLALGFPVALVLAWAFEVTPEGIRRASSAPDERSARPASIADAAILLALLVVAAFTGVQVFRPQAAPSVATSAADASAADVVATVDVADAADGRPSIAVLPFVDISAARDQEYFADGLSEELLNELAQLEGLRVIARTSSWAFKGQNADVRDIADALGVDHVLEGSVRKAGDQLRITAQLIDASDGAHLWSETYDRELDDVFAIQEQISMAVADALSVTLGVGARPRRYGGTDSFDAYDAYLRGRALGVVSTATGAFDFDQSVAELERAVALDPAYAQAWAELSTSYGWRALVLDLPRDEMERTLANMERTALRAVEIAPDRWESQAALAWAHLTRRRWLEADRAMTRARELADRAGASMGQSYWILPAELGRFEEQLAYLEDARQVDPLSPNVPAGIINALIVLGRDEEVAAEIERNRALPLDPVSTFTQLMWALRQGDEDLVEERLAQAVATGNAQAVLLKDIWRSPDAARAALADAVRELELLPRAQLTGYFQVAAHYGDDDLAMALLRDANLEKDAYGGYWPMWAPALENVRSTGAFKDFLREIGLVDFWRETGKWPDFCRPLGEDDFVCE